MSFSPEWLALREPADNRARNTEVLAAVSAFASKFERPLVIDLAAGTGSTYRAIAPLLPAGQHWHLFDFDQNLLDTAAGLLAGSPTQGHQVNLVTDLAKVFDQKPDLVVTSAFLDLVSSDWLDGLIAELTARKLPFYAALSYDGRANIDPPNALDQAVIEAVNRHQRTDKGFGAALGPEAANETIRRLKAAGYSVLEGRSDWLFKPDEGLVQSMIIDGWAQAVYELGEMDDKALLDWASWHLTRIADGGTEIMVGHIDLFAMPNG
jgi:hypothetical protein